MLTEISISAAANNWKGLEIWLPSFISVLTLIINIMYYAFGQPKVSFKLQRKESLVQTTQEFLQFLSDIISYDDFNKVPTNVRKYCLKIHLCFKTGTAPKKIADLLEDIFILSKKRKNYTKDDEIEEWANDIRSKGRLLREMLAKYTGVF